MYDKIRNLHGKMNNYSIYASNGPAMVGFEIYRHLRIGDQLLNNVMVESGLAMTLRETTSEVEIEVLTMESLIKNEQDLVYIVSATIDGKLIDRREAGVAAANTMIEATAPVFKIFRLLILLGVLTIPLFGFGVLVLMFLFPMYLNTIPIVKKQIRCINNFKAIMSGKEVKKPEAPAVVTGFKFTD